MTGELLSVSNLETPAVIEIPIDGYPDGTPLIQHGTPLVLHESVGLQGRRPVRRLLCRPNSLTSFMAMLFYVDAMVERGSSPPELILPLMPGARQDRLNDTGDYLFTAKSVARELNFRNFPSVTLVDPHSDVSAALVDRARVIHAVDCINPSAGKYAAVVSPDAGAEKRAGQVARKLGVPLIHAWKTRDVSTGAISGFGMGKELLPLGSLVLVVDDLCDGGGTFIGLAGLIEREGFKAHLWTTHGLYSKGTAELLQHYGHLYCTDSVLGPREGVIEIDVCKKLLTKGTL